jgi:hypothetical protein
MKIIVCLFFLAHFSNEIFSQPAKLCPYNSSLFGDVVKMYTYLDILEKQHLSIFVPNFLKSKNGLALDSLINGLRNHQFQVQKRFPKDSTNTSFLCNTNKERIDYINSLSILGNQLESIRGDTTISSFQYGDIISANHFLVQSRSALMNIMDASVRHKVLLDSMASQHEKTLTSICQSEKRLKRHVSVWSGVCAGLIGIVAILVVANGK